MGCSTQPDGRRTIERIIGPLAYRDFYLKKGEIIAWDRHDFDHNTQMWWGLVHAKVRTAGGNEFEKTIRAGDILLIKKEYWHQLAALDDSHFSCVFPHRAPDGEIVEEYSGWPGGFR